MTIHFHINHTTSYGEKVLLNVLVDDGDTKRKAQIEMTTVDGTEWTCHFNNAGAKANSHLDYFFSTEIAGREHDREWTGITHRIDINFTRCDKLHVYNIWHTPNDEAPHYSTAYTECLRPRKNGTVQRAVFARTVRLIVRAPQLLSTDRLALTCSDTCMGAWDTSKAILMTEHAPCEWQADINAGSVSHNAECKFHIIHADGTTTPETAETRHLHLTGIGTYEAIVQELPEARFDISCDAPNITSTSIARLRTDKSFGIGDLGDLSAFIEQVAGNRRHNVVAIPPIGDTTSTHTDADANPYSATSAYAIHPILCDLRQLPQVADAEKRQAFENTRISLNADNGSSYTATLGAKLSYLRSIFTQEGEHTTHSTAFKHWFKDNEHWLVPYAQYSYLRDAYSMPDFRLWPAHNEWTEAERGLLQNPRTKAYKKLAFIYYAQYIMHTQLSAVHSTARKHGIVLMADMTANINPNGCDVWQDSDATTSHTWWSRRLRHAEQYFDACLLAPAIMSQRLIVESTRLWCKTW